VKALALALLVGSAALLRADDAPPELKAIEAKYDLATIDSHEAKRDKYIMELAALHWHLVRHDLPGIDAVDFEINRHPMPATADSKKLTKLRVGTWQSPRHDYLYRADGTWTMDPDAGIPDSTHGTWSIHGNQYTDAFTGAVPAETTTYTIILLTDSTFIFAEPGTAGAYYEQREDKGHLPLRRDAPAP
jgi:hypothetical protein